MKTIRECSLTVTNNCSLHSRPHLLRTRTAGAKIPGRLERCHEVVLGADHLLGDTADAVGTGADSVELSSRDAAAAAADRGSVAAGVNTLEAGWRHEVERGECARFPKGMPKNNVSHTNRVKRDFGD